MTSVDPYPRLADTLAEISARLQDISDEIRVAAGPAPAQQAADAPPQSYPAPFVPGFGPSFASPATAPPYAAPSAHGYPPAPHHAPESHYPPAHRYPPAADYPPFPSGEPAGRPPATLWERLSREGAGSKVVAWIGGAVTLAGVVLLLVLAVQRGYIGPLPRVLLGVALGVALVAIALRLHRSPDERTGAIAIAATGAAVLYLDAIAATAYYHFVPAWAGLVVGLAVATGGVLLAWHWDAEVLAVFVVMGCAASAPFLTQDVALLVGFLLVLQVATSPAQLHRDWPSLAPIAAAPPVLAVVLDTVVGALGRHSDALMIAALAMATSLVQVTLATLLVRRPRASIELPIALVLAAPSRRWSPPPWCRGTTPLRSLVVSAPRSSPSARPDVRCGCRRTSPTPPSSPVWPPCSKPPASPAPAMPAPSRCSSAPCCSPSWQSGCATSRPSAPLPCSAQPVWPRRSPRPAPTT